MLRATRAAWPALTIVAAVTTAVLAVAGAAGAAAVPRTVALLALVLAAATVLGLLTAVLTPRPRQHERRDALLDLAALAAGVWTVAAGSVGFLLYLGVAPALDAPTFGPGLVAFLEEEAVGRAWLVATVLAAVLTALLVAVRSIGGLIVLRPLVLAALVPVALAVPPVGAPVGDQRSVTSAVFVMLSAGAVWAGVTGARALSSAEADVSGSTRAASAAGVLLVGVPGAVLMITRGGTPVAVAALIVVLAAGALVLLPRAAAGALRLQLLLLGVATGLAVATAVNLRAPSSPDRSTPAEILTGAPLPPPLSAARLLTAWQPDALWLSVCAVLLVAYGRQLARTRRSGTAWSPVRTASWSIGVVVLAWATSGGPAVYQEVLISVHLAQHVVLALLVPLLLAGGAPLRLVSTAFASSGRRSGTWIGDLGRSTGLRVLARPVPAAALVVLGFLVLYGTGALQWSVSAPLGTEWAVVQSVGTGVLLVAACCRAGTRRRPAVVVVAVLIVAEGVTGAVAVVGSGLLLPGWFGAMGWGTDALVDQRSGALVAAGSAALLTLVLLAIVIRARPGGGVQPRRPSPARVVAVEV